VSTSATSDQLGDTLNNSIFLVAPAQPDAASDFISSQRQESNFVKICAGRWEDNRVLFVPKRSVILNHDAELALHPGSKL
jgi:hypothetical protein